MRFFKTTLAGFIGALLAIFVFIAIFVLVLVSQISSDDDKVAVKDQAVLHLKLDNALADRSGMKTDLMSLSFDKSMGIKEITDLLKDAAEDKRIKGIFLEPTVFTGGFANVEELRNALNNFKKSGKFVIAFSESYSHKSYYLSSVADKIYLNPAGVVQFTGFSAQIMFYKTMLDKLGVEPVVIRYGKFKSAVEPFMQDYMSEANREQTTKYLESFWNTMLTGISKERGISVEQLNSYADSLAVTSAEICKNLKFVDNLMYRDQVIDELNKLAEMKDDKEDVQLLSMKDYSNADKKSEKTKKFSSNKIALIYATGEIRSGSGDDNTIGSESLSEEIKKAREDSTVKAVVLRVNSPGGSALASEVIWRETVLTQAEKPFIVSMGNLAASGGYYISCAADTIVAEPNTITGSIGVFGLLFNGVDLMNKIGLKVETVNTNKYSDVGSTLRKMSNFEKENIQKGVNDIYGVFIKRVADGRNMTTEQVDKIGQGRVWSGVDAKEIGLVDVMGGLETAIEIAKQKAGLEDYRIVEFPEKNKYLSMLENFTTEAKVETMRNQTGIFFRYVERLQKLDKMQGTQARLPYFIEIN